MVLVPGVAGRQDKSPLHFATLGFGQLLLTKKSTQPQAKRRVPRCRIGDGNKKKLGRIGEELTEWGRILGALTTSATGNPSHMRGAPAGDITEQRETVGSRDTLSQNKLSEPLHCPVIPLYFFFLFRGHAVP